jgi:hypothetical protein
MSGELRTLTVSMTTVDPEHMLPTHLIAAELAGADPHEWAQYRLRRHLQRAADDFVKANPGLFACPVEVN